MKRTFRFSLETEPSTATYLIWAVFLLGAVVRVLGLGYQSLWIDEAVSVQSCQQGFMDVVLLKDPTPPLYYVCLYFWIKLFGNGLVAVRSLSAIFGSLTIFAIYGVATRLVNRKTGLLAALLLAVSPINLYLSQMARTYSLLALLSAVSIYLYLKLLGEKKTRAVILYALCNVLLVYSHVFGWFVIIAQNLHFLWRYRLRAITKERWWIYLQIIPAVLFLPWFYRYITQCDDHGWVASAQLLVEFSALGAHLTVGIEESSLSAIVILPVLALLIIKRSRQGFLYVWLLVPILLPLLVTLLVSPIFMARYIYYISIPATILFAQALLQLKWRRAATALALLVFTGCAIHQQTRLNNDPWDQVAAYIQQVRENDEPIVVIKFYETRPLSYYYDRDAFNAPDHEDRLAQGGIFGVEGLDAVKQHAYPALLLITSRMGLEAEADEIEAFYADHYETVSSKTFIIQSGKKHGNSITVRSLRRRGTTAVLQ
ncbi:MAG: hypothetical protein GXY61_05675 [Lentisphaerae bacterium]|nr:hypothetical protein [Lentisphaerota bacterium]